MVKRFLDMVEDQIKNSYSQSIHFDEPKVKDRVGRSILATLPAALASLSSGYCWGYSSSALEDLQNAGTSSAFRLTVEQGSWFSSMICFGMMIGFPFIGWAINKFGRKGTMMLCAIPFVLGWLLISYARNVAMLYAGRSITGVACGAASFTSSVYVGEIAAARVRGALCNLKCLGFSLGVLLSLAVGVLCHWRWLAFIGTIPPTLVLILMIPMPQSPHWLLGKNRTSEALEAFLWLRGPNADVDEECSTIKKALDHQGRLQFMDIRTPAIAKPLIISTGIFVFSNFCGVDAVLFNAADLFKIAGFVNEKLVAVSVGISQLVGGLFSCFLIENVGRRKLLLTSALGMSVSLITLGVFFEISVPANQISWLSILSLFLFNSLFSLAWGPLPWVLISEMFPVRARGFPCSFVIMVFAVTQFFETTTYHSMTTVLTIQGAYWVYAGCCILGFLFVYFLLPETKGKTLEEIEDLFNRSVKHAYERIE